MTSHRFARLALAVVGGLVFATVAGAGEPPGTVTAVTLDRGNGQRETRFVAPGEWLPLQCYYAMPYRGGAVLRFEYTDRRFVVSIDGGPPRPSWIRASGQEGLDGLSRALAQGARGFAVICRPDDLDALPRLPRGRDITLTVHGLEDVALLRKQTGISGLSLAVKGPCDLSPLADLRDVTSLRLSGKEVRDLGPLARLPKLTWLRLSGAHALPTLPDLPGLRGLRLMASKPAPDLRPIARLRRLAALHLHCGADLIDITPLAGLTELEALGLAGAGLTSLEPLAGMSRLRYLNLSRCERVADLRPLTELSKLAELRLTNCTRITDLSPVACVARRGGRVYVDEGLEPQLEKLVDGADF